MDVPSESARRASAAGGVQATKALNPGTFAIWKYVIDKPAKAPRMPPGAVIVSVHEQNDYPCLWVQVDASYDADEEIRIFHVIMTGSEFDATGLIYRGTAHTHGGQIVLHVFEDEGAAP